MLLSIAYIFLLLEIIVRFIVIIFAPTDYAYYGEVMFTFTISNLVGNTIALGRPIICNIEEKDQFDREEILYVLVVKFSVASIIAYLINLNYFIVFLGLLYPSLGVLASKNVGIWFSLKLRIIKLIFWINLCILLTLKINLENILIFIICAILISTIYKVKFNYLLLVNTINLQSIKFTVSSILNLSITFFERIIAKIFFSDEVLGLFINIREISNLPNYLMSPFISEKFFSKKKNNFKHPIFKFIFAISMICLVILSIINEFKTTIIITIFVIGLLNLINLIFYIKNEINNKFFITWMIKIFSTLLLICLAIIMSTFLNFITNHFSLLVLVMIISLAQLFMLQFYAKSQKF